MKTPDELRKTALKAREAALREAEKEREQERRANQKARESWTEQVPARILSVEGLMQEAASDGRTNASYFYGQRSTNTFSFAPSFTFLHQDALDALLAHFRGLGFKAEIRYESTTTYQNGEPWSGPDNVYIDLDWATP